MMACKLYQIMLWRYCKGVDDEGLQNVRRHGVQHNRNSVSTMALLKRLSLAHSSALLKDLVLLRGLC